VSAGQRAGVCWAQASAHPGMCCIRVLCVADQVGPRIQLAETCAPRALKACRHVGPMSWHARSKQASKQIAEARHVVTYCGDTLGAPGQLQRLSDAPKHVAHSALACFTVHGLYPARCAASQHICAACTQRACIGAHAHAARTQGMLGWSAGLVRKRIGNMPRAHWRPRLRGVRTAGALRLEGVQESCA